MLLDARAVPGTSNYVGPGECTVDEVASLKQLATAGWTIESSSGSWQLSMQSLKSITLRFSLTDPIDVFRRRAGIPLQAATIFELILELKHSAWQQLAIPLKARDRREVAPFTGSRWAWHVLGEILPGKSADFYKNVTAAGGIAGSTKRENLKSVTAHGEEDIGAEEPAWFSRALDTAPEEGSDCEDGEEESTKEIDPEVDVFSPTGHEDPMGMEEISADADVDVGPAEPSEDANEAVDPPPAPPAPSAPSRSYVGRSRLFHEKSFEFGTFTIRFRDDQSILYPDRVPSWMTTCPHHGCNKAIQINMPTEETALRRLLQWCLDAPKYRSKEDKCCCQTNQPTNKINLKFKTLKFKDTNFKL
eukprot:Skav233653  [mRNA]  locus=scaffold2779:895027:898113:+ [translate_table: standard]